MKTKILLTSFKTWLPHHKSNSSDDLLVKFQKQDYSSIVSLFFLRNLDVNVESASKKLIEEIDKTHPNVIVCCGMAEKRTKLTIESNAWCHDKCLYTSIDLYELTKSTIDTEVSHDAGKFVCEGLYYRILEYIQYKNIGCIFIHVPILEGKSNSIEQDFNSIILYLATRSA